MCRLVRIVSIVAGAGALVACGPAWAAPEITLAAIATGRLYIVGTTEKPHMPVVLEDKFRTESDDKGKFQYELVYIPPAASFPRRSTARPWRRWSAIAASNARSSRRTPSPVRQGRSHPCRRSHPPARVSRVRRGRTGPRPPHRPPGRARMSGRNRPMLRPPAPRGKLRSTGRRCHRSDRPSRRRRQLRRPRPSSPSSRHANPSRRHERFRTMPARRLRTNGLMRWQPEPLHRAAGSTFAVGATSRSIWTELIRVRSRQEVQQGQQTAHQPQRSPCPPAADRDPRRRRQHRLPMLLGCPAPDWRGRVRAP